MDAASLRGTISDFLTSFTHEVLYQRGLYSPELFARCRLYDVAVRRSRHPRLNAYIEMAVNGVTDSFMSGTGRRFGVLVLNKAGVCVERYVAALALRPEILASVDPADVEAALRSCLMKLQYLETSLKPLPPGCTFEIMAYADDRSALPIASWVDAEPGRASGPVGAYSEGSVSSGGDASSDGGRPSFDQDDGGGDHGRAPSPTSPSSLLPLKSTSVGGGALSVQVFVEGGGPPGRPGSPVLGRV